MDNSFAENTGASNAETAVQHREEPSPFLLPLLFLSVLFSYYEIMLRLFCAESPMKGIIYPLLSGAAAGLIISAITSLLPPKAVRVITTVISAAVGVFFAAECLVKNNFQTYMELSSLLSGTDGVMTDYSENLASSVINSLPAIAAFFLPPVIYGVFGKKLRIAPAARGKLFPSLMAAAAAVVFIFLTRFFLISDKLLEQYEKEYYFDTSAESFGLLTGLGMNAKNSLFGGSDDSGFSDIGGGFDMSSFENYDHERNLALGYEPPAEYESPAVTAVTSVTETEPTQTSLPIEETAPEPDETALSELESTADNASVNDAAVNAVTEPPAETSVPAETAQTEAAESIPAETAAPLPIKRPVPNEDVNYGYNIMDIDFSPASKNKAGAELNQYVTSLAPANKNAYTGLFEGKNLILICAEAMSDIVIDEELTPTLYRMTHNGIYFSDYYQPTWGGSTSTGEYSFVLGLVPRSGITSMLDTKSNNNYFTLGNQMQRLGYSSCAFHNGTYDFYNRDQTHKNLGYDNYLAFGNGLENYMRRYSDDSVMLDKTLDLYLDRQPFSLYYMSISGHCTYTAKNNKVTENLQRVKDRYGNKYKDTTNYYLCYQMELDKALRIVIEKLEAAGIADDTVICITPDHYPYGLEISTAFGNSEDYVTDLYGYKYSTPWEKDHSSWILWSGCLENDYNDYACEIDSPTYSLDIVPTLSNLFGLEYDSRLLVGRDVFSDAEAIALWNNYSWKTERGCYNAYSRRFIPNEGYEYDDAYVKRINSIVKNRIYFSGQAVKCDYYGLLFGKDEFTGQ